MSGKQSGSSSNSQHDEATLGVGGPTSGEEGSTLTHETMAETGGSGGSGLTRNQSGKAGGASRQSDDTGAGSQPDQPEGAGTAVQSGARGAQDTRSHQAGGSETGLGVPETGANQTPADLDRQKK